MDKEKKESIITTLIKQHRGLQKDLGGVAEILKSEKIDSKEIVKGFKKFEKDLFEHLELENDVFYVNLLRDMKKKDQSTEKTEQFIEEMKDIEKVVVAFLEKYKKEADVSDNLKEFKKEFAGIVETLNLRVEAEEAGVYGYWGLF